MSHKTCGYLQVVKANNHGGYGCPADIWSLGCTVLEMFTREVPYHPLESVSIVLLTHVLVPPYELRFAFLESYDMYQRSLTRIFRTFGSFFNGTLTIPRFSKICDLCGPQMPAVYRIGKGTPPPVPETLSHDARDFILKCLRVKPEDRPTAAQLLGHAFVVRPPPLTTSAGDESALHLC